MSLIKRYKQWYDYDRHFPIIWLSYQSRVRNDVEAAYNQPGGKEFFNTEYEASLTESLRVLESWQLRIMALQFALYAFITSGYFTPSSSVDILGVSLHSAPGLKELVLSVAATLALFMVLVSTSKDLRVAILEQLSLLKTDPNFRDLALVATPAAFHFRIYVAKAFRNYIFPLFVTSALNALVFVFIIAFMAALYFMTWVLQIFLLIDIHRHPALGFASTLVFWYMISVQVFGVLWIVRSHVRLPFRDKHALLELEQLRQTDLAAFFVMRGKLFPKHRKPR